MAVIVQIQEKLRLYRRSSAIDASRSSGLAASHGTGCHGSGDDPGVDISVHPQGKRRGPRIIYFARVELNSLFKLYAARVSCGEWRDYAIDHCPGFALFSFFRHSHEHPAFAIAKIADPQRAGFRYEVFAGRKTLRRCGTLADAITALDPPLSLVSRGSLPSA